MSHINFVSPVSKVLCLKVVIGFALYQEGLEEKGSVGFHWAQTKDLIRISCENQLWTP